MRTLIEYRTPEEAEAAFYDAFTRADLEAMMAVWANEEDIVCAHPAGPSLRGRTAVQASWRAMFADGPSMHFEVSSRAAHIEARLAIHCVYESISHGTDFRQHARVFATNAYKLTNRGWRMVLHHASPDRVSRTSDLSGPRVH